MAKETYIAISGGFDPLHEGHIDLIEEAAIYGKVIVILNSDEWLVRKKGKPFMKYAARAKVLSALKDVYNVIPAMDDDGTVCETLKQLKPHLFANGGDRKADNTPEVDLCNAYGITALFGVGGDKKESSSRLVEEAIQFHDW